MDVTAHKCADRSVSFLLTAPFLVEIGMPRKLSWRSGPVIGKSLFCACTLRLDRRGSRGLGPLGPVESQVRVARVCGKTSAAARLISRGRAPRAEPEHTSALLLVISVGLTRSAAKTVLRISTTPLPPVLTDVWQDLPLVSDQCSRCRVVLFDPCGSDTTVVEHTYADDNNNNNK